MLSILLAVWAIRTLTHWLQARLSQRGASAVIADLSGQVLAAVTAREPRQLAAQRDAAATVVARGLDTLRPYFTEYLPALLLAALLTPLSALVLGLYDLKSAVIVAITLPLIPIFMVLIGLATADRSAAALAAMATLQARLLDLIAGIPTLRALGRATGPERRVSELATAHRRSGIATLRIAFLSALVLELLATLGVAVIAVSIGLRLVFGQISLTAGLTVLLLAPDVYWPLRRIGVAFHAAEDGRTAADKAFALIENSATDSELTVPGSRTVAARGAAILLDKLSVAGRDGLAPRDLSAVIEPGRVTVLTGANGTGKSTTLQVIAGITAATTGRVAVAGVGFEIGIADLEPTAWWRQVSWLPQRPVLIPGTVAENLALFGTLDNVEIACATSGFDLVLTELRDGMRTVTGRGGVGLSLGQRQRLGLARALGSPAPVLLLDEPTAHLDAATEARVLRAIVERARAGATVVVVGHREQVTGIGDRVVEVAGAENVHHAGV
jgi:ATP-binding cassette subfamily C protein CydD